MQILISLAFFIALTIAIYYVGYRHYARPARYYEHLGTAVVETTVHPDDPLAGPPATVIRIVRRIGEKAPVSPADVAMTRRYLIAGGYRSDGAVQTFYGIKLLLGLCFLAFAAYLRTYLPVSPLIQLIFVGAAALGGYALPNLVLDQLVDRRQENLRFALPDALDLMVVCVEAGLGLDQAILKVAEEMNITHKDLAEEFGLVTLEMQAGKSRSESLRNLAERTGETELRKLVAILVQTDRFGTSMADSLRTHSDFMRVRRSQEAQERANKVGVKLVFPIFFCILPAMLVVVAGPGLLQITKHLFPMMRQFSNVHGS
jgi:tight adherence protein C